MIEIDEQFQSLIPPLSAVERARLEENLREAGKARNPLIVWPCDGRQILLDGHNRFDICTEYGLPYTVEELQFDDRASAEQWMLKEQLGRRNLDPVVASELRGRLYNSRKKPHGGNQIAIDQNDQSLHTVDQVAAETGVSRGTIVRDGRFAEAIDKVREVVPEIQEKLRSREVSKSEVIQAAARVDEAPAEVAEQLRKPHVTNNSGNAEWYTPAYIISAATLVMEEIDLDPASCKSANRIVKAKTFYDSEKDGLQQKWKGRIWLNPPYGAGTVGKFASKFAEAIRDGHEGMVLVNNATETEWFQEVAAVSSAICFPSSRIKFLNESLQPANSPLQGQAILYAGPNTTKFAEVFREIGMVMFSDPPAKDLHLCIVPGGMPLEVSEVAVNKLDADEPLTGWFVFDTAEAATDEGQKHYDIDDIQAMSVSEFLKG